jgi:hypothetical protein
LQKQAKQGGRPAPAAVVAINTLLLVCGSALGLLGTASSLIASFKR